MHTQPATWLRWTARILGGLMTLFLAIFALDSTGAAEAMIHLTPAAVTLALVAVAWRWPVLGGSGFVAAGCAYAVTAWHQPTWVAAIAGPLVLVGVLFIASARSVRPGSAAA